MDTWVLYTFVIHREANWLHVLYELVRRGRVRSIDHSISIDLKDYQGGV